MPCYIIVQLRFNDEKCFREDQQRFARIFRQAGARLLAADDSPELLEGSWTGDRVVMIEFGTISRATAFLKSEAYRRLTEERSVAADTTSLFVKGLEYA